ncbi:Hermansky-Pudlak syndrome 5 [Portunus trituberculatus]|uniref:Hermansky-Pudlak syndrome 5 n=1 Tax=Portunus trituberculatus TaxID=210409 RepID=A0A5B7EHI6_PORTR|nr:Hermansky-Pudlak syndrome 5 [Portunus trituberculatus]
MTLESSIIQLDYQDGYLLVSTLTHSYVCNTNSETFSQVGTKLRQGQYGSCFCQVNHSGISSPCTETWEGVEDLKASLTSSSEKFGLSDCYEAKEEEQVYHSYDLRKDRPTKTASPMLMSHVFCARPGTRIWEADYSGKVLVTHQLKSALIVPPAEVLLTDGSFGEKELLEEISFLAETLYPTDKTRKEIFDQEPAMKSSVKALHPPVSVAFTKMMSFYNKYLLAISAYGLYIIDPATSKILIWVSVSEGIKDVKVSGNSLIYKSGNDCIQNFMLQDGIVNPILAEVKKNGNNCRLLKALCLWNVDLNNKKKTC